MCPPLEGVLQSKLPVDQLVEHGINIVGTTILIIQVVSRLPHVNIYSPWLLTFGIPSNGLKPSRSAEKGNASSPMGSSCRSASSGRRRSPPPPPLSDRGCLPRCSWYFRQPPATVMDQCPGLRMTLVQPSLRASKFS